MNIVTSIIGAFKPKSLARDMITTTSYSIIGKGIGFLVPFFIATWYGVSAQTDGFFFTYGIILFLAGIVAPVIENVIVPYIAEFSSQNKSVNHFIGSLLVISTIILCLFFIPFAFLVKPGLAFVTRFDIANRHLVYVLLLETFPLVIFLTWTSILSGTLNAYKQFGIPAISPAIRAIVNLAIIFILKDVWGVHAIAIGYVLGELFRIIFLLIVIYRSKLFFPVLNFNFDQKIREFIHTASYQTFGMIAAGLMSVIDKTMASWLSTGSVSILEYANRLYDIPLSFMYTGFIVILLSHWSSRYYEFGIKRLNEDLIKTSKVIIPLTLFITIILISFHAPLVNLAYNRGSFNPDALSAVGRIWCYYLIGLCPFFFVQLFNRRYLVLRKTKILLWLAVLWNILKIFLNLLFIPLMNVEGIALSTSILFIMASVILFILFKRENAHAK